MILRVALVVGSGGGLWLGVVVCVLKDEGPHTRNFVFMTSMSCFYYLKYNVSSYLH